MFWIIWILGTKVHVDISHDSVSGATSYRTDSGSSMSISVFHVQLRLASCSCNSVDIRSGSFWTSGFDSFHSVSLPFLSFALFRQSVRSVVSFVLLVGCQYRDQQHLASISSCLASSVSSVIWVMYWCLDC